MHRHQQHQNQEFWTTFYICQKVTKNSVITTIRAHTWIKKKMQLENYNLNKRCAQVNNEKSHVPTNAN